MVLASMKGMPFLLNLFPNFITAAPPKILLPLLSKETKDPLLSGDISPASAILKLSIFPSIPFQPVSTADVSLCGQHLSSHGAPKSPKH